MTLFMYRKIIRLLFVLPVLASSAGFAQQPDQQAHNPVWDHDFPDPTVIRTPVGDFYAYGTQGGFIEQTPQGPKEQRALIQVARSKDGIHWQWVGDALPEKPQWASHNFWAPHVSYDALRKRYILYYAAKSRAADTGMCIGVAISPRPEGPFRDLGKPLLCGKEFETIDPMAFDDPATGKHYLYWGSDFKPIKVRELSEDRLSFAPGSKEQVALYPGKDGDYDKLIEGPWVIYHAGKYFLFYSGNNCCGVNAHYAVMVARADRPEGPFIRYSEAHGTHSSVILQANKIWMAPGHNSAVSDASGQLWMYYHAISRHSYDSAYAQNPKFGFISRVMLRDRIRFKNGWPVVGNGSPGF